MRTLGFRGRVVLWSVVVVTAALGLFGAGAAWNLRRELLANLDQEIQDEAAAVDDEISDQEAENQLPKTETFSEEDLSRFLHLEIRDAAQRVLYRSPALGSQEVFPRSPRERPYEVNLQGRRIRFAQFRRDGITFVLGKDLQSIDESLAGLLRAYFLTLPLVIVAVGAGGWLIAQRALTPLRGIIAQAEKISVSDLHQRMPPPPAQDEIGDLTNVLNEMFDRLQRSFEQVTRFTSDASHELKTPLALMQAEVEDALKSDFLASEPRQLLSDLSEQCSRLAQIVDSLLLLSRADDRRLVLAQEPVDLVRLMRELMEDAEILAQPTELSLECELADPVTTRGDRRLLARAVMNLIDNAIKHNQPRGRVTIAATASNGDATLSIANTGPGLATDGAAQIFDRFYRGDSSHSNETPGHGLGLSIAREIARAHGGDVLLIHSDAEWTEFRLLLPLVNQT